MLMQPETRTRDILNLMNVTKIYNGAAAVESLNLEIKNGEFFSILGPSGCGKTTTLRLISGLESPDAGKVYLENTEMTSVPPHRRPVNTVFQNYALFPHMSVARNVGYGLTIKRVAKETIKQRVNEMLKLVNLDGFGERMPQQLSGGQRQRVALARALINSPKVLLLDEPLAALDLQLRLEMQAVLRELQHNLGITFIYITHDQGEALSLSHRIAVMNKGVLQQVGTAEEIYRYPATPFVARFIGKTSLLRGRKIAQDNTWVTVALAGETVQATYDIGSDLANELLISVRPEDVTVSRSDLSDKLHFHARVHRVTYYGNGREVIFTLQDGQQLVAFVTARDEIGNIQQGDELAVSWDSKFARVIDKGGESR